MKKNGKKIYRLSFKITLMIVFMIVLCSVFVGVFLYRNFARELYVLKGTTAQTAADTLASTLNPEAVRMLDLYETEGYYYYEIEHVVSDAAARTNFYFLYILALDSDDESAMEVIYGQDATGTLTVPLGYQDDIVNWNEATLRCFETASHTYSAPYRSKGFSNLMSGHEPILDDEGKIVGVRTYSRPYGTDGFGTIMSGYSPILDSAGNVVAIVGLDIPIHDVTAQLASMRNQIILIIMAFVLGFSGITFIFSKFRIGNPITKLSRLSENIVAGNLDYDINIKSRDEIGILSDNLMQVKSILKNLNSDIGELVKTAAAGQMQTRAAVSNYSGDWGLLLKEMNHLLDTLNVPLDYACSIQKNMLPNHTTFKKAFPDYSVIWSPRDIVGGDIYWMKNFSEGSVLCVCDCTGHGTPGALLTMLVMSAFDTMIDETNYKDTAQTIWNLEQRLVSVFNIEEVEGRKRRATDIREGCDLAVLYIAESGEVSISSGHTPVYICDGKEVRRIKGQSINVGEGKIKKKEDIKITTVPFDPNNKFYIASDGLYDQIGGTKEPHLPFGYGAFKRIILENHDNRQTAISGKVLDAFEEHRGTELRRDDITLISFKLRRDATL